MSFETKNNELFEKYNEILDKVSNIMEKAFNNQLVLEENYLKTKLKCCTCKTTHIFAAKMYPKKKFIVYV